MSESLSGTNFETKDKKIVVEGTHGSGWLRDRHSAQAWPDCVFPHTYFRSHLGICSLVTFWFSPLTVSRPTCPLPYGMGIKQPEEDIHFDKAKWWLLQISEVTLKEVKNTKYFDILFFLSKLFTHTHIYIHAYTFVFQKLCCGIGYVPPLEMVLNSGILEGWKYFFKRTMVLKIMKGDPYFFCISLL